jgi:lipid-A-disaccharide synthase
MPPPPSLQVALELGRALGGAALLPARLADAAFTRDALRAELLADLGRPRRPIAEAGPWPRLPDRPLRLFVSAAEASGEQHALQILSALRARLDEGRAPAWEFVGLGGERLRAAGVRTLGDPVARATMGVRGALAQLPFYLELLHGAARELARCDVALLVDSPALHVPLGRIARRCGVRVAHFVAPQHWAWAAWRTRGYAGAVDRTLALLPFEPDWFARRGVDVRHVGHPLLEALPADPPSPADARRTALALLPGSRASVIERNLPWMLALLADLRAARGDLEVVLAHAERRHAELLRAIVRRAGATDWVRMELGDLHGALSRSRAAFAVSGTVLVDLVHQRLPGVVVYRLGGRAAVALYGRLYHAPWFGLPNLVAGREILPEFGLAGEGPRREVAAALERALDDPATRRTAVRDLERVAEALGPRGACRRAARAVLDLAAGEAP